jgi:predicted nucleic acid-binding protein
MQRPLRVLLDVNIWLGNLIAYDRGHVGTANQELVSKLSRGEWRTSVRQSQLVASFELLDTLERVLRRLNAPEYKIRAYVDAIPDIMRFGPEELDPYLLLAGRDQLAMHDREDAGILATAFASGTDLLITDNLDDFVTKDSVVLDTQKSAVTRHRQLFAIRHQRDGVDLIVAHPFDVLGWLRHDLDFEPEKLWQSIARMAGAI